jgi:hypothetical protein
MNLPDSRQLSIGLWSYASIVVQDGIQLEFDKIEGEVRLFGSGRDARTRGRFQRVVSGDATASPNAVIRVYDGAGNVIETHEHTGDFKDS